MNAPDGATTNGAGMAKEVQRDLRDRWDDRSAATRDCRPQVSRKERGHVAGGGRQSFGANISAAPHALLADTYDGSANRAIYSSR